MAKLKWYGKYCELLNIQLWCMHGFLTNIYFCNNVHNWSYIPCSANQTLGKSGCWTNYATQTGNWHKIFSIKPTCFILYVCCMKGNCTCWHKGVKHAPSITQIFLGISVVIPQNQKEYFIYLPNTWKTVSSHDVVFDETFYSTLAYTSRPYLEALTM